MFDVVDPNVQAVAAEGEVREPFPIRRESRTAIAPGFEIRGV